MLSSQHVECGIFRRHFNTEEHEGLANLRMLTPKHADVFINKLAHMKADGHPLCVPDRGGQLHEVVAKHANRAIIYKDKWFEADCFAVRDVANLINVPDMIVSLDENNLDDSRLLKCSYCGERRHTFADCPKKREQRHITGSEYCPSCLKKGKEELHWSHNCKAMIARTG